MLPGVKNICAAAIQLVLCTYLFVLLPQVKKKQESLRMKPKKLWSQMHLSCRRYPAGLCGQHLRETL